jgi:hypothetical protein
MHRKITLAPFAVASDGTVFANVAHLVGDVAATKLIQHAQRMDGGLFIGVAVSRQQKKSLVLALDNAGAETIAKMGGSRPRRDARSIRPSSGRSR